MNADRVQEIMLMIAGPCLLLYYWLKRQRRIWVEKNKAESDRCFKKFKRNLDRYQPQARVPTKERSWLTDSHWRN